MSNELATIVYYSHACRDYDDAALLGLLQVARRNNQRNDITGMLLYHDGNFVQALEGQSTAVEKLFARISRDPNHDGIIPTKLMTIETRQFPNWSMGFLTLTSLAETARQSTNDFLEQRPGSKDGIDASLAWSLLKSFRSSVSG